MVGLSSISSSIQTQRVDRFSIADANSDGFVNEAEFIASRPEDVSESAASQKFAELDTEGTGVLTQTQIEQGSGGNLGALQGIISGESLAAILQLNEEKQPTITLEDLFNQIDSDDDGAVTLEEFVAAKPDSVTEEEATALFNAIDSESDGVVVLEEFVSGLAKPGGAAAEDDSAEEVKGPPPPPPASAGVEDFDELDTNEDGTVSIQELMAAYAEAAEEDAQIYGYEDDKSILQQAASAYNNTSSNGLDTFAAVSAFA